MCGEKCCDGVDPGATPRPVDLQPGLRIVPVPPPPVTIQNLTVDEIVDNTYANFGWIWERTHRSSHRTATNAAHPARVGQELNSGLSAKAGPATHRQLCEDSRRRRLPASRCRTIRPPRSVSPVPPARTTSDEPKWPRLPVSHSLRHLRHLRRPRLPEGAPTGPGRRPRRARPPPARPAPVSVHPTQAGPTQADHLVTAVAVRVPAVCSSRA